MRIALRVEYDGAGFSGWETQREQRTVQATLEAALARIAVAPVRTICAGRTDTGVHATGQIVHFDTDAVRPLRAWTLGCNTHLPSDVAVTWSGHVPDDFHARFAARRRHYRYVIVNRRMPSPTLARRATWEHRDLDVVRMSAAAATLVGEHDFSSFRAAGCQARTAVRTIERLSVHRRAEHVHIEVSANAFLQHMVRNLAGVLMDIGAGRREPEWAAAVLGARDRSAGGVTARPDGLYLVGVDYPARFAVPGVSDNGPLW